MQNQKVTIPSYPTISLELFKSSLLKSSMKSIELQIRKMTDERNNLTLCVNTYKIIFKSLAFIHTDQMMKKTIQRLRYMCISSAIFLWTVHAYNGEIILLCCSCTVLPQSNYHQFTPVKKVLQHHTPTSEGPMLPPRLLG